MGVIYRAVHQETGEAVALKMVKVPKQALLLTIRREIRALARLRHPGIVRVLSDGVRDGMPWYAMNVVEGTSLRRYMRPVAHDAGASTAVPSAGAQAEASAALSILQRLCAPLAYLHGEGLAHCDLKPENVLVTATDFPVLIDFGLAYGGGYAAREQLSVVDAAGTPWYIAPEQIRGSRIDARADLYALGCMLYEIVTGRPPFAGSLVEILDQHLHHSPQSPQVLAPHLPDELAELILQLLAKEPAARVGHVQAVACALARVGFGGGDCWSDAPPPQPCLYRPRFAGRAGELRQLLQAIEELQRGNGGIVLVGGESGVGKTRLVLELAERVRRMGVLELTGNCRAGHANALCPLSGVFEWLTDRCRERGRAEADRLLAKRGKVLADYFPNLADLPGQDRYPDAAPLPPEKARQRLFRYLLQTLGALAQDRPLLLLLDDLQWADELTLSFLGDAAMHQSLATVPCLVVGTYRTEEVAHPVLAELAASGAVERILLGRLAADSVSAMIADMLALRPAPAVFGGFLARQSEGNPFFVGEYVRAAVEDGLIWQGEEGDWRVGAAGEEAARAEDYEALALPRAIRDLVLQRLNRLCPETRTLLEVASVIGREVPVALLESVARQSPDVFMAGLAELSARQMLGDGDQGDLQFCHHKLQEVIYASLGAEQRRELHRSVATLLASGAVPGSRQGELGRHWEQAGEVTRAASCYLAGARTAKSCYANEEAERLYRAYARLSSLPSPPGIAARNELGEEILRATGRMREAEIEHRAALAESMAIGNRESEAESLRGLGLVLGDTGRGSEAQELFAQALDIQRERRDRRGEGRTLRHIGKLYHDQGLIDDARSFFEAALVATREAGDRRHEGITLVSLAGACYEQGDSERARALLEEALAIHVQVGDRSFAGVTLSNLAALQMERGCAREARALYEQALAIHREVGDRRTEGSTIGNLAILHWTQGRVAPARRLLEQAISIAREVGDRKGEGLLVSNFAQLMYEQGHPEQARALSEQALAIQRALGNRQDEGDVLVTLSEWHRETSGDLAAAAELNAQATAIFRELDARRSLLFSIVNAGHIALAREVSAAPLLDQAQRLARELGATTDATLGPGLDKLQRAQAAFAAGATARLFRGKMIDDYSEPQRRLFASLRLIGAEQAEP